MGGLYAMHEGRKRQRFNSSLPKRRRTQAMSAGQFPELKEDASAFYEWAERVTPDEPYGVRFHLFELRRALDNLNRLINQYERIVQNSTNSDE